MTKTFKSYSLRIVLSLFTLAMGASAKAQSWNDASKRIVWNVLSGDPRISVTPVATSVNIGGYQEVALRVKNNFTATLYVKMQLTVTDKCGQSKTHTFTETLKSYESKGGSTWFEGFGVAENCKEGGEIAKGQKNRISYLEYRLLEIRDLDAEKKAEEDKRLAAQAKLAADKEKKQKEADAKKKADADAAQKTKDAEAQKKKDAEAKKTKDAEATTGDAATKAKSSANGSEESTSGSSSGSSSSEMTPAEKQAQKEAQIAAQKQLEKEQKEAEAKAEQERLDKKQDEYDSWRSQKKAEQAQYEQQATEASVLFFITVGALIYKNMGNVNPDYIFQNFKEKPQFYTGFEFGFSASNYPMLFQSDYHTVVGGRDVYREELTKVNAFTMNLDLKYKMGAEHPTYGGGYGYVAAKAGFSPIFDAFMLSPLTVGGRVNGGWKWIRGFADISAGSRTFTRTDNDPEESGTGKSNFKFTKMQYGVQFTTKPNSDYKRSHISIGFINEKITPGPNGGSYASETGVMYSSKSPVIKGYMFEWKKDHTFNWYINYYPKYLYSGETGGLSRSSDFNTKPTGMFLELGFIRAVDWWFN